MTSQTEIIEEATVENAQVETLVNADYEHGFVTDIETVASLIMHRFVWLIFQQGRTYP